MYLQLNGRVLPPPRLHYGSGALRNVTPKEAKEGEWRVDMAAGCPAYRKNKRIRYALYIAVGPVGQRRQDGIAYCQVRPPICRWLVWFGLVLPPS